MRASSSRSMPAVVAALSFHKVPPYPASHGCVRVIYEDADWLTARLHIGWPVHSWDE